MSHSKGFLKLVDEAKKKIKELNIDDVLKKIKSGDAFYFLDVREDREWFQGHIEGAEHVGKGVIERDIESLIPDHNADIVLYCGGGYRSAIAAENLQRMGYTNVKSMDGGIRSWMERGLPITQAGDREE